MSHPLLKAAIRFVFISLLLILPANIVSACLCTPRPNVLEAYDAADEVLIVRVLSVGAVEETPLGNLYLDNSRRTTVRVARVYKGRSNVNDQLDVGQGGAPGCSWQFDPDSTDTEFLVYLKTSEKLGDRWHVSFCSRSNRVEWAREDLLYLDNQEKLRGKTRVSGIYLGTQFSLLDGANRKIRIIGSQKSYETNTDQNGVYEIYDLPPGDYRIEPEIPAGWKFLGWYPRSTTAVHGRFTPGESGRFVLGPKKHASISMMFRPDNSVAGAIVDPNGNPLPKICARLWKPGHLEGVSDEACTNEKGHFQFDSVVPGTYHLVLNPSGTPSGAEPFPRLFYPGTTQRDKAVLIDVGVGDKVKGINMVIPTMLETVTVEGVLYFSNNRPARNIKVHFLPAAVTKDVNGSAEAQTDEKGRFSLTVIKGLSGDVGSETFGYAGMFENCPAFDTLVQNSPQKYIAFKAPAIRIDAERDINNLVLRFPFPKCKTKD